MIKQRRAALKAVRHRGTIDLDEQVVRKVGQQVHIQHAIVPVERAGVVDLLGIAIGAAIHPVAESR